METIVLIGMPSAGKTSVGRLLAKKSGRVFLDGDDLIRALTGEPLAATIARIGAEGFLMAEERTLCAVSEENAVIATGGSAVYSEKAMAHFKSLGKIVYLRLSKEEVLRRIPDFTARGVVMRGNVSTLSELYAERAPLYEKYADFTLECGGKTPEEIAEELLHL